MVSTDLKNMLVKLDHFPNLRAENEKYLSCHQLERVAPYSNKKQQTKNLQKQTHSLTVGRPPTHWLSCCIQGPWHQWGPVRPGVAVVCCCSCRVFGCWNMDIWESTCVDQGFFAWEFSLRSRFLFIARYHRAPRIELLDLGHSQMSSIDISALHFTFYSSMFTGVRDYQKTGCTSPVV